jgi:hypothetical protein
MIKVILLNSPELNDINHQIRCINIGLCKGEVLVHLTMFTDGYSEIFTNETYREKYCMFCLKIIMF